MALALYRKYRPQKFSDITGQHHVKVTLEREIAADKVAHAYLFSGTRGTGKTSTARIFAKAINCLKRKPGTGEPCGSCELCTLIREGRALDIIEIDAASHTGVENVREVIVETAKYAPSQARFKVFIIDEVHMLTPGAWNALLKIMEEPPAHVVFILATTEVHKVPATILSRCQRFDFHRVEGEELVILLRSIAEKEKVKVEEDVLATVARVSEGCVRDAQGLLEQLLALGERKVDAKVAALVLPRGSIPDALELLENIATGKTKDGLMLIGKLRDDGVDLEQFTLEVLEIARAIILFKITEQKELLKVYGMPVQKQFQELSKSFAVSRLLAVVESFSKARLALKIARIPTLPLEVAFLEVGGEEGVVRRGAVDLEETQGSSADLPHNDRGTNRNLASEHARSRQAAHDSNSRSSLVLAPRRDYSKGKLPSGAAGFLGKAPADPVSRDLASGTPTLSDVKSKWPELLKAVQNENHSFSFLLSSSEPIEINDDKVQIGVQYPFHCDKLNEPKCRAILENILRNILNAPVRVEAVVQAKNAAVPDAMDDVLRTLGGKVVE